MLTTIYEIPGEFFAYRDDEDLLFEDTLDGPIVLAWRNAESLARAILAAVKAEKAEVT